jgi:hypothetical protein
MKEKGKFHVAGKNAIVLVSQAETFEKRVIVLTSMRRNTDSSRLISA